MKKVSEKDRICTIRLLKVSCLTLSRKSQLIFDIPKEPQDVGNNDPKPPNKHDSAWKEELATRTLRVHGRKRNVKFKEKKIPNNDGMCTFEE